MVVLVVVVIMAVALVVLVVVVVPQLVSWGHMAACIPIPVIVSSSYLMSFCR